MTERKRQQSLTDSVEKAGATTLHRVHCPQCAFVASARSEAHATSAVQEHYEAMHVRKLEVA